MARQHRPATGVARGRSKSPSRLWAFPPALEYRPPSLRRYRPNIGLIACGGITQAHLTAYPNAGYRVVALADLVESRARARQSEFYSDGAVYTDYRDILRRDDIEVVDSAAHPTERAPLLKAALEARKHLLSPKPFVLDIDYGQTLCDLADRKGVRLAVNQNGRWAPHIAYIRAAIAKGLIGTPRRPTRRALEPLLSRHSPRLQYPPPCRPHDYAIHWFDMINCFRPGLKATRVYVSNAYAPHQTAHAPLLGQAIVEFDHAQASLQFDAAVTVGGRETGYVAGTKGDLRYDGPGLQSVDLTLTTPRGTASPTLEGKWFTDGFHGTMGELLRAIEEQREPSNSGRQNLRCLDRCFPAI